MNFLEQKSFIDSSYQIFIEMRQRSWSLIPGSHVLEERVILLIFGKQFQNLMSSSEKFHGQVGGGRTTLNGRKAIFPTSGLNKF